MRPLPNVGVRSSERSAESGAAVSAPASAVAGGSALLVDCPLGGSDGCAERGHARGGVGYAAADGRPARFSTATCAAHALGGTDQCPCGCSPGDDGGGLCPVAH